MTFESVREPRTSVEVNKSLRAGANTFSPYDVRRTSAASSSITAYSPRRVSAASAPSGGAYDARRTSAASNSAAAGYDFRLSSGASTTTTSSPSSAYGTTTTTSSSPSPAYGSRHASVARASIAAYNAHLISTRNTPTVAYDVRRTPVGSSTPAAAGACDVRRASAASNSINSV